MNCDEFGQRMHHCLDQRLPLDGDGELWRHAEGCDSCWADLHAWRQISAIMPAPDSNVRPRPTRRNLYRLVSVVVSLAAVILFALILVGHDQNSVSSTVDSVAIDDHTAALARTGSQLDPELWWRHVQDRDWVGQTMPAVRSVRESVAPIGRSLIRAVTILTVGGSEQTS